MLQIIGDDLRGGVEITYRMDGSLFNLGHFRANTKTTTTSLVELQYANNAQVSATQEDGLQAINDFTTAYRWLELTSMHEDQGSLSANNCHIIIRTNHHGGQRSARE